MNYNAQSPKWKTFLFVEKNFSVRDEEKENFYFNYRIVWWYMTFYLKMPCLTCKASTWYCFFSPSTSSWCHPISNNCRTRKTLLFYIRTAWKCPKQYKKKLEEKREYVFFGMFIEKIQKRRDGICFNSFATKNDKTIVCLSFSVSHRELTQCDIFAFENIFAMWFSL